MTAAIDRIPITFNDALMKYAKRPLCDDLGGESPLGLLLKTFSFSRDNFQDPTSQQAPKLLACIEELRRIGEDVNHLHRDLRSLQKGRHLIAGEDFVAEDAYA
jgi:hypothetical protein